MYRSLASLQRDNRRCRLCLEAGHPLGSRPVVEGHSGQRAYLLGQAPGVVEGAELRPWRGRAGQTLRRWLRLDEEAFYATFYCAAVTRCYPGRAPSGRGDRTPTPREQELCAFWREQELRLLEPQLIVTVGGLALRRLLGIGSLTEAIGKSYVLGGAIVVPLPHPSGASGWLNDPANRARLGKALTHVRRELARLVEVLVVRPEGPADDAAVIQVVRRAMRPQEALLVERLREEGAVAYSLVAEESDAVVGHALFTVAAVGTEKALALGPLAVAPEHQSRGIGTALVRAGLARARADGWRLVIVLGDPAYYQRFGFAPAHAMGIESPFEHSGDAFQALVLSGDRPPPHGKVTYAHAFTEIEGNDER